jgi:cytochrome b561
MLMTPTSHGNDASHPERYGRVAQVIHWATAFLVLAAFLYGPGGSESRVYASSRDFDRHLHETLGSCVFALVIVRVAWRLVDRRPEPAPVARWMGMAAKAVQGLLYLFLFAVPLTAIAGAWLEGHPLAWLGGIEIAPPFAPSHDLGATLAWLHGWLGDAILWTAGLHALAALYHQIVLRDHVLASMLPAWADRALSRGRDRRP